MGAAPNTPVGLLNHLHVMLDFHMVAPQME